MPELPEAETIVRDLRRKVPGRTIAAVKVTWPDVLTAPLTPRALARALKNRRIKTVDRRAKNILVRFDEGTILMINLGMTGRVVASSAKRAAELTHVAVRFDLDDGSALLYDDARRFGRLEVFTRESWIEREQLFGPEPLSAAFTAEYLHQATRKSISPIRNWLLDQTKVAGVGNIYAAEALFRARVRPTRRANTLTRTETAQLRDAIREVLAAAIVARGTTVNDYRDANGEAGGFAPLLRVYDRAGLPCVRCRTTLKRVVLTNRSAFYCPKCQK
ncbi:MAG: bifunctional DNA-formamidopyrimidine glycosylase/DNA-(apurinic or apyrimidinic site) lyase [Gemmatimonadota bacterium]